MWVAIVDENKNKNRIQPLNPIPKLESCGLCVDSLPFSGRVRERG
jgi:hypothetical protein